MGNRFNFNFSTGFSTKWRGLTNFHIKMTNAHRFQFGHCCENKFPYFESQNEIFIRSQTEIEASFCDVIIKSIEYHVKTSSMQGKRHLWYTNEQYHFTLCSIYGCQQLWITHFASKLHHFTFTMGFIFTQFSHQIHFLDTIFLFVSLCVLFHAQIVHYFWYGKKIE